MSWNQSHFWYPICILGDQYFQTLCMQGTGYLDVCTNCTSATVMCICCVQPRALWLKSCVPPSSKHRCICESFWVKAFIWCAFVVSVMFTLYFAPVVLIRYFPRMHACVPCVSRYLVHSHVYVRASMYSVCCVHDGHTFACCMCCDFFIFVVVWSFWGTQVWCVGAEPVCY